MEEVPFNHSVSMLAQRKPTVPPLSPPRLDRTILDTHRLPSPVLRWSTDSSSSAASNSAEKQSTYITSRQTDANSCTEIDNHGEEVKNGEKEQVCDPNIMQSEFLECDSNAAVEPPERDLNGDVIMRYIEHKTHNDEDEQDESIELAGSA